MSEGVGWVTVYLPMATLTWSPARMSAVSGESATGGGVQQDASSLFHHQHSLGTFIREHLIVWLENLHSCGHGSRGYWIVGACFYQSPMQRRRYWVNRQGNTYRCVGPDQPGSLKTNRMEHSLGVIFGALGGLFWSRNLEYRDALPKTLIY